MPTGTVVSVMQRVVFEIPRTRQVVMNPRKRQAEKTPVRIPAVTGCSKQN